MGNGTCSGFSRGHIDGGFSRGEDRVDRRGGRDASGGLER